MNIKIIYLEGAKQFAIIDDNGNRFSTTPEMVGSMLNKGHQITRSHESFYTDVEIEEMEVKNKLFEAQQTARDIFEKEQRILLFSLVNGEIVWLPNVGSYTHEYQKIIEHYKEQEEINRTCTENQLTFIQIDLYYWAILDEDSCVQLYVTGAKQLKSWIRVEKTRGLKAQAQAWCEKHGEEYTYITAKSGAVHIVHQRKIIGTVFPPYMGGDTTFEDIHPVQLPEPIQSAADMLIDMMDKRAKK